MRPFLFAVLVAAATHVASADHAHGVAEGSRNVLSVDVFARTESAAFLRTQLPRLSDTDLDRLAEALGDLPLAIAQAADLLAETAMPVDDYLHGLDQHAAELLDSDGWQAHDALRDSAAGVP